MYRTALQVDRIAALQCVALQRTAADIERDTCAERIVLQCATDHVKVASGGRNAGQCVCAVEIGDPRTVECTVVSARAIEVETGTRGRRERTAMRLTVRREIKPTTVDIQCARIGRTSAVAGRVDKRIVVRCADAGTGDMTR